MALDFGKLDFSVSFNRLTAFPLDAKSYFESYESASAAALTAEEAGSNQSSYYYGQVISVVENGVAKLYIIQPDKTLKEAGAAVAFNENVFAQNSDGSIDLYGFASAVAGAQLTKGSDGKLSWIKPDTTTVEGLSTAVDSLAATVNGTESSEGLVDKVAALEEGIANVYTKDEVDAKLGSVLSYKGSVADYAALPSDASVGDVYNVETEDAEHGIKAGDNVAWNGSSWDVLAGTVDLSSYLTSASAAESYVAKEVGKSLISDELIAKLNGMDASGEANYVKSVSDDFAVDEEGKLSLNAIDQSKVSGLAEALAEINGKLPTNDFTDALKEKLDGIAAGAQVNILESVKMNGAALEIAEKAVNIPLAAAETVGVVKGSDAKNGVAISDDGSMSVNSLNISKLVQEEDETLILNCGGAAV